jgi:hypothetical protein
MHFQWRCLQSMKIIKTCFSIRPLSIFLRKKLLCMLAMKSWWKPVALISCCKLAPVASKIATNFRGVFYNKWKCKKHAVPLPKQDVLWHKFWLPFILAKRKIGQYGFKSQIDLKDSVGMNETAGFLHCH